MTALARSDAVANAPGVASTRGSFAIVLALAVVVVALVTPFFFLSLTVQKIPSLTLLRAVGAPAGYLVRGLIQQVVLVLGVALLVAVGLLGAATAAVNAGLPLAIEPRALVIGTVVIVGLSLLGRGLLGLARAAHRSVPGRESPGARRHRMKLALLELRRRPWRFAPAVIALVLLTGLLLTLGGLLDGLYSGFTGALRAQPGALLTYAADANLSVVRSRIDAATTAEVERAPGVEQVGGLGTVLLGAEVPGQTTEASVALFGYQRAPRGVPAPPETGQVYADTSLKAYGVKEGQSLLLGPKRYAGVGRGLGVRHRLPAPGRVVGRHRHVARRARLGPARPGARARHVPGADGLDGCRRRPGPGGGRHRRRHGR